MKKRKIRIIDKKSVYIDKSVIFGNNIVIYPNNTIMGETVIEDGAIIMPNNYIENSVIGKNCVIEYSHIVGSTIHANTSVGPFARIRGNSEIGEYCRVGNYVEIKNSTVDNGTKMAHLTYIGDAIIGKDCNIGCGVIFVNYNGKDKNRSIVEDHCFIGSNSNIIAPVHIATNSYICAGTTITKDTNPNDFVIGRSTPTIKPDRANMYW